MNSRPMAAFCVAMSLAMPAVPATPSLPQPRPDAIRAHMRFLADDLLEGRGTASRGYDIAARYVATQFALADLSSGAGDSYLQNVPLRSMRVDETHSSLSLLPGSDPKLAREYVVFSAHLDHLGVGEPEHGDAIYNGALDNASGTAILIEAARVFAARHPRPRRSLLFVAATGEEAGLIGSDYFANRPTVDKAALVADAPQRPRWNAHDFFGEQFGAKAGSGAGR